MRGIHVVAACFVAANCWAQGTPTDFSRLQIVAPAPERAGDQALSCAEISREIGQIMQKRNVSGAAAASKEKVCRSAQVLSQQVAEQQQLQQAQLPALIAANRAPPPVANAIHAKANAEKLALETRQQPGRQQARADQVSGAGDMLGAFNDPRLMRLALLAEEHQCAETMPQPPPEQTAAGACDSVPASAGQVAPGARETVRSTCRLRSPP